MVYNFNIQFQLIGLILLTMIGLMSFSRKNLNMMSFRAYKYLFSIVVLSLMLDILSIFTINYREDVGYFTNEIICRLYIFSLVTVSACVLFYTLSEIYSGELKYKKKLLLFLIPEAVAVPCVFLTNIDFHMDSESIYTYGTSTDLGSAAVCLYFGISLVYLFIYRKKINQGRRNSIIFMAAALVGTGIFQSFHRKYLVAGIAMSIAMVYVYLTLENPEDNIDRKTGAFNSDAFSLYVKALCLAKKKFSLINLHFEGYKYIQDIYGQEIMRDLVLQVTEYLDSFPEAKLFATGEADFTFVMPEDDKFASYVQKLRQDFNREWQIENIGVELPATIVAFPAEKMTYDYEEILNIFNHFRNEVGHDTDFDYIFIDNKELRDKADNDEIERVLMKAIANDTIDAYYQPIYDDTGRIIAAEALARIKDDSGEVIINDEILPIAEKSGIIIKIGIRTFENICRFVRDNDIRKMGIERIGVNLSPLQCMQRNLADNFIDMMSHYGLDGSYFTFEITDSPNNYSKGTLMHNINKLIASGADFAMDRFGREYSNLMNITEMPVDIVKIDRTTVADCFDDTKEFSEAIALTIKTLAQIGKKVVAVGIENKDEYNGLKRLEVGYMQGTYLSGVLCESDFLDLINKSRKDKN